MKFRSSSKDLRESYEAFPEGAKDEFWRQVNEILLWRGWDRNGGMFKVLGNPRSKEVDRISSIFCENGLAVEEYT